MSDNSHDQARAQMDSILEMVAALDCDYDRLEDLRDERDGWEPEDNDGAEWAIANQEDAEELADLEQKAGECTSREDAEKRIKEDALEVVVRSGWMQPGDDDCKPEEFKILLCTGGPAAQIMGELDDNGEPTRAWLEHQDWYEPWAEYHGENFDAEALLTYAKQFFFGQ